MISRLFSEILNSLISMFEGKNTIIEFVMEAAIEMNTLSSF